MPNPSPSPFPLDEHEVLRAIVRSSDSAIFAKDLDGMIRSWNPGAERLYGWTASEAIGSHVSLLAAPGKEAEIERIVSTVAEGRRIEPFETVRRRKDGTTLRVHLVVSPVADREGRVVGASVMAWDVTAAHRAEEERKALEDRYRFLFEGSADAISMSTPDGRIVDVNPSFARLLGLPREVIRARHAGSFYVDDSDRDRIGGILLEEGEVREFPTALRRGDGSVVEVEMSSAVQTDAGGRPVAFFSIVRDVTAQRAAEAASRRQNAELEDRVRARTAALERVNRELEAFAYSVSHDLRAPLRALEGFSRALEEDYGDRLDGTAGDYLARIRAASLRMRDLIDDLLRLSRITRAELRVTEVDLSSLAREVAEDLRGRFPTDPDRIEIGEGLVARADPPLVRQLLANLLGNALKFTGRNPGARIAFAAGAEPGSFVVRDNGAGFDPKYAAKLFTPFSRLHTEHEFPGTGIGLATVQRIVSRHGGWIRAEGRVGEGAAFTFHLGSAEEGKT